MILFLFIAITLFWSVKAIFAESFSLSFAFLFGTALCLWAGSGLKGSIIGGFKKRQPYQVFGGLIGTVLFVGGGILLALHSGFRVVVFGFTIKGLYWCIIGFVVGWISTPRQVILSPSSTHPSDPQNMGKF